jgi:lysophospholipase L1-like esterase
MRRSNPDVAFTPLHTRSALKTKEEANMHNWHQFVAMGDSFTEGIGDAVDGFARLGAIDRLAVALRQGNPGIEYINLAQRGLSVAEIRERQLVTALGLEPEFVSLVAGANDVLSGRFSVTRLEEELGTMYRALRQNGAIVGTANIPCFPVLRTFPQSLQTRMLRNATKANASIARLAEENQVILVDAWTISSSMAMEDWSQDGIHFNSRGYFRFAKEILVVIERGIGKKLGEIEMP